MCTFLHIHKHHMCRSSLCKMLSTYLRCAFSHSYGCIKCDKHSLWLFRKQAGICSQAITVSWRQPWHTMMLTICSVAVSRTCPDCSQLLMKLCQAVMQLCGVRHGTTYTCMVCSEELNRPENKDLKSFIDKLAGVKQIIDDKGKAAGESSCLSATHCS